MSLSENGQKTFDRVKLVLEKAKPYGGNGFDTSVGIENYLFVVKKDNSIWVHNLPTQADLDATGLSVEDFNTCLAGLEDKDLLQKKNFSPSEDSPLWYHALPDGELVADGNVPVPTPVLLNAPDNASNNEEVNRRDNNNNEKQEDL